MNLKTRTGKQNGKIRGCAKISEAEEWEILQQIRMTPSQRQAIAKKLREKFCGKKNPDVLEYHRKK